jgi:hypothetical protein
MKRYSDISGRFTPVPFASADRPEATMPFVAVIGLHRSGSSCLAGVLHLLGVHMGDMLGGFEPTGGFEALDLAELCEDVYPFPQTEPRLPHDEVVRRLRRYVADASRSAASLGKQLAGGKYPHLCALGDVLREVCGARLRVIHIDRPLEESIASLQTRSRRATGWIAAKDADAERVQRWLWESKQELLRQVPHLDVQYADLLADPRAEVDRIAAWLRIVPPDYAVARAVAHVQPQRATHSFSESPSRA